MLSSFRCLNIYDIAPFSTPINSIKFSPSPKKRIISDKIPFLRGNLAADIYIYKYIYVCTHRPNYKSLNNFVRFIAFLLHIFASSMRADKLNWWENMLNIMLTEHESRSALTNTHTHTILKVRSFMSTKKSSPPFNSTSKAKEKPTFFHWNLSLKSLKFLMDLIRGRVGACYVWVWGHNINRRNELIDSSFRW